MWKSPLYYIIIILLYCHSPYLKKDITHHLQSRQTIKEKLKSATLSLDERSILESRYSEVFFFLNIKFSFINFNYVKLKLNGMYGFNESLKVLQSSKSSSVSGCSITCFCSLHLNMGFIIFTYTLKI